MKKEYDLKKLKVKHRGPLPKDTKVQKTVRLDLNVLNWLIKEGEIRGIPYQTLINATLKEAMNRHQAPDTSDERVRKIVKEELEKLAS